MSAFVLCLLFLMWCMTAEPDSDAEIRYKWEKA